MPTYVDHILGTLKLHTNKWIFFKYKNAKLQNIKQKNFLEEGKQKKREKKRPGS
jgi:hypothetical protein